MGPSAWLLTCLLALLKNSHIHGLIVTYTIRICLFALLKEEEMFQVNFLEIANLRLLSLSPLPLLALIICSTISAAPRACSLACWYRIFCFSISFSWQATQKHRARYNFNLIGSLFLFILFSSPWRMAYLKGLFFPLFFFLLIFCTAL